jgi:hypothetical protein
LVGWQFFDKNIIPPMVRDQKSFFTTMSGGSVERTDRIGHDERFCIAP